MAIWNGQNSREYYREIGKQFAYEGIDESYLKDVTPEELVQFKIGFEEAKEEIKRSSRYEEFELNNESRTVHK